MSLLNVHERTMSAPAEVVGRLLDRLGTDDDPLWPDAWQPMCLDRPLGVGADGGHGPVRYWVSAYEPSERVRFTFHPESGIDGHHELTVVPRGPARCILRHVLQGRTRGAMRVLVPLIVEPLHDAVLEDLLDNAEREATGTVERPARWSRWVRFWWWLTEPPRVRRVLGPVATTLMADAADRPSPLGSWEIDRLPKAPLDARPWADEVFSSPLWTMVGLGSAPRHVVQSIGPPPGTACSAPLRDPQSQEVMISGAGLRASLHVRRDAVILTTSAYGRGRRGRAQRAVARRIHPLIARRQLRRAWRNLSRTSNPRP